VTIYPWMPEIPMESTEQNIRRPSLKKLYPSPHSAGNEKPSRRMP
jgi:hypothetical protein